MESCTPKARLTVEIETGNTSHASPPGTLCKCLQLALEAAHKAREQRQVWAEEEHNRTAEQVGPTAHYLMMAGAVMGEDLRTGKGRQRQRTQIPMCFARCLLTEKKLVSAWTLSLEFEMG